MTEFTKEYTFTGFMPSGNPFDWYYDENKKTAFTTSIEVSKWNSQPNVRDVVTIEKTSDLQNVNRAWINNKLVYRRDIQKEIESEKRMNALYENIRIEKGL